MFCCFGHKWPRILTPQPGMEAIPPALEDEVLTYRTAHKVPFLLIFNLYLCLSENHLQSQINSAFMERDFAVYQTPQLRLRVLGI